jgi:lysophospholipase L1-like esterase
MEVIDMTNSPRWEPNEPSSAWPRSRLATRTLGNGAERAYVRFAALGDSATCGVGDVADGRLRGWSRILADAIAQNHDVSFCNLAVPGSTTDDVWRRQLSDAVDHRPNLASLIVGLNDTLRSDWNPATARGRLLQTADELACCGATLLTVTFHDHARVFGLPRFLARPLSERIEQLNEIYEEIRLHYDSIHVDLRQEPAVYRRASWTIDRLHPSEIGHRLLALRFAEQLDDRGLSVTYPSLDCIRDVPSRFEELAWMVSAALPWLARRLRDLAPHVIGKARANLVNRLRMVAVPRRPRPEQPAERIDTRTPSGRVLPY